MLCSFHLMHADEPTQGSIFRKEFYVNEWKFNALIGSVSLAPDMPVKICISFPTK